jgi:hypothetical protein
LCTEYFESKVGDQNWMVFIFIHVQWFTGHHAMLHHQDVVRGDELHLWVWGYLGVLAVILSKELWVTNKGRSFSSML